MLRQSDHTLYFMNQNEQIHAFASDISRVIERHRFELDLSVAAAIGTLEVAKLELFQHEAAILHGDEWQPIGGSPRDGTVFMAYVPHSDPIAGGFQFCAVWNLDGRLLCMMSGDDFTEKATLWRAAHPLPGDDRGGRQRQAPSRTDKRKDQS